MTFLTKEFCNFTYAFVTIYDSNPDKMITLVSGNQNGVEKIKIYYNGIDKRHNHSENITMKRLMEMQRFIERNFIWLNKAYYGKSEDSRVYQIMSLNPKTKLLKLLLLF